MIVEPSVAMFFDHVRTEKAHSVYFLRDFPFLLFPVGILKLSFYERSYSKRFLCVPIRFCLILGSVAVLDDKKVSYLSPILLPFARPHCLSFVGGSF